MTLRMGELFAGYPVTKTHTAWCPVCGEGIPMELHITARRTLIRRRWVLSMASDTADLWAHIWSHQEGSS